eukprot:TRINITY_DN19432_c0_g1_i1.p1 TRINITY_DN19432_c0_g1~~TRINITY_DN19432_c0_g1_i1.p1  ORF type:complete len:422 (-),score=78.60 TRINITY_DN19432_c0_g1_i1:398-1663(-)
MVLTSKQKNELHAAIAEYFQASGFEAACTAFCEEAGLDRESANSGTGLLEKKWTSVVRLQKKIMELESKVEQAETDLAERGGKKGKSNSASLPKTVARHELSGFRGPVTHVCFHPVVPLVAASGEDGTVKVWDYESGQFEKSLRGHTNAVQYLAFDPSGNMLASCSADLSIKIWDFNSYDNLKTLNGHEHNVSGVCFIPPGDYIASCSRDTTIKIWEASTGFCTKTLTGHDDWVRRVIASADGKLLASCSTDQTIRLWDPDSGTCTAVLRGHTNVIETIAFAPESSHNIIRASVQGGAGEDEPPATEQGPTTSGAQACRYLVSGSRDKTVRLWDLTTQQCMRTLEGHDNWVRGVVFHSSGLHLISSSDDKSIKVWSLENLRCVRTLQEAHPHFVSCLDFNQRFPMLVSGGIDQKVKIWECS